MGLAISFVRAIFISVALALAISMAVPTEAQVNPQITATAPAPDRYKVDANFVDMTRGQVRMPITDVAIGPDGQGLRYIRMFGNGGGGSNYDLTLGNNYGQPEWVANIGFTSYRFSLSGGNYSSTDGKGATLTSSGGTYTLTAPDGTIYYFGNTTAVTLYVYTRARVTSITRPDGEKETLNWIDLTYCNDNIDGCPGGYNTITRLQAVTNNYGYQIHFNYHRASVGPQKDAAGWLQIDSINAINMAVDYCDPTAHSCSYTQAWPTVTYSYSTDGTGPISVAKLISANGPVYLTTMYSVVGNTYSITMPGSSSSDYSYTTRSTSPFYVTSVTNEGVTTAYSYTLSGNTATMVVTDASNHSTTIVSDLDVGLPKMITDALGHVTRYFYDKSATRMGQLTHIVPPEGQIDPGTGLPASGYVKYSYDGRGNIMEERRVSNTPGTPADIVRSWSYDTTCSQPAKCNLPNSMSDPNGNVTDYYYNGNSGNITYELSPAPNGSSKRRETAYTYSSISAYFKNSAGNIVSSGQPVTKLTQISRCQSNINGVVSLQPFLPCVDGADEQRTVISYGPQVSGVGNNVQPAAVTNQDGASTIVATTSMAYDIYGNLSAVDGPLSGTDDTTRFVYDVGGRLLHVIGPDPDGAGARIPQATNYHFNSHGLQDWVSVGTVNTPTDITFSTFVPAQTAVTSYTSERRPAQIQLHVGSQTGTVRATTQQHYDDVLRRPDCTAVRMNPADWGSATGACTPKTTGSDGPDRVTYLQYDALGRPISATTGYGTTDAISQTQFYTPNGLLNGIVDGENNLTYFGYDGLSRHVITFYPKKAKGSGEADANNRDYFDYDANGNVTIFWRSDGTTISYGYDNLNRLVSSTLPANQGNNANSTMTYDLIGRILTQNVANSNYTANLSYSYDALNRKTSETSTAGGTKYFQYNLAGNLTQLKWGIDNLAINYAYDVSGQVQTIKEGTTTTLATYSYDSLGRRTGVSYLNGTSRSYAWDDVSRLAGLQIDVSGTAQDQVIGQIGGTGTPILYNPASQITKIPHSNDSYAWTASHNETTNYTSNGLNQYTAIGAASLTYDALGNLTGDGTHTYGYSSLNQLTTVDSARFDYDAAGNLIYDQADAVKFDYAGSTMISEYSGTTLLRRYVPGPGVDEPVVWYEGAGTSDRRYFQADERGSIVIATNSSGASLGIRAYDEYGQPSGSNVARFGYTGQAYLGQVDLFYYKARMYSARLGRFLQPDPIGYAGGMNLYAYVGNDPVNMSDPTGQLANIPIKLLNDENSGSISEGDANEIYDILIVATRLHSELGIDSQALDYTHFIPVTFQATSSNGGAAPQKTQGKHQCSSPVGTRIGFDAALALGAGARFGFGLNYDQNTGDWYFRGYFEGAVGLAANVGATYALGARGHPAEGLHSASNVNFGGGVGVISGGAQNNISSDRAAGSGWSGNGGLSVGPALGAEATYSGGLSYTKRLGNGGGC